jgi:hypothetical protein
MMFDCAAFVRLLGALLAATFLMTVAGRGDAPRTEWQITKCRVYSEALERLKEAGWEELSASFLEENAAFVQKGCVARIAVCPRTRADLDAANILTIASMNAGTASSFLPFDCNGS